MVIAFNIIASVLNVAYYLFTDNVLSPINLFIGGVCFGVSIISIIQKEILTYDDSIRTTNTRIHSALTASYRRSTRANSDSTRT